MRNLQKTLLVPKFLALNSQDLLSPYAKLRQIELELMVTKEELVVEKGARIKADEAYRLGLSQVLCEPQQCENHILQLLYTLANHQQAMMSIKHLIQVATQQPHSYAQQEQQHFAALWSSETHWQQVQKFWKKKDLKD